jgi:peptide/nickel transport system substrate-binding protein
VETYYWSSVLRQRLSRRRALVASGASVASAFLIACSGKDDGTGGDKSNLISKPVETTKQAKRTGILKDRTFADPPTLSVITGGSNPHNAVGPLVYSSLFRYKPGLMKPSEKEIIGDLVESWEWSPDGLQVTMKLRQGVKYHNKPPVNGRAFDMEDVLRTWDRFSRTSGARTSLLNALNPQAPVLSLTATDSKTLLLKLKEPIVYTLDYFSSANASSGLVMAPREIDSTFDARSDMIGTGPYSLAKYTPSASFAFKRNSEYWDPDEALVDGVEMPIISEYAVALAQFKAGNMYSMGSDDSSGKVAPDDILPVKREEPRLSIYQSGFGEPFRRLLGFGWLPLPSGKVPFFDERVRQAVSMSIDRDLYIDTFFNVSRFAKEGLPVATRWNSHLLATEEGLWLDPRGKDFGPNAKYFRHDLTEAKKMLSAAGYPDGFETISNYVTSGEVGFLKQIEVTDGFIKELGIKTTVHSVDYVSEYQPRYRDGKGQYEGWTYKTPAGAGAAGAIGSLANEYWSKSGAASFHGFSTSGRNDQSGDPQLDPLIEKTRVERDTEKRRALIFDIQRHLAKAMYVIQPPGPTTGFTMAWPCLGNFLVYEGARQNYRLWVDETKPPFKGG